jgi:hypothetical protein
VENMQISRRWKKWNTCQEVLVREKRNKFDKKLSLKKKERTEKSLISEKKKKMCF